MLYFEKLQLRKFKVEKRSLQLLQYMEKQISSQKLHSFSVI